MMEQVYGGDSASATLPICCSNAAVVSARTVCLFTQGENPSEPGSATIGVTTSIGSAAPFITPRVNNCLVYTSSSARIPVRHISPTVRPHSRQVEPFHAWRSACFVIVSIVTSATIPVSVRQWERSQTGRLRRLQSSFLGHGLSTARGQCPVGIHQRKLRGPITVAELSPARSPPTE